MYSLLRDIHLALARTDIKRHPEWEEIKGLIFLLIPVETAWFVVSLASLLAATHWMTRLSFFIIVVVTLFILSTDLKRLRGLALRVTKRRYLTPRPIR